MMSARPAHPRRWLANALAIVSASVLAFVAQSAFGDEKYNGSPSDVMLEGFHWTSSDSHEPDWYEIVRQNAGAIKDAGFTVVWMPPPAQSVDAQGYMPVEWMNLNNHYGTAEELKGAIDALKPARAIADIVVNHRNGEHTAGADFDKPAFADNVAAVVNTDECHCGKGEQDGGTDFDGSRDLDHSNASVRQNVKDWLDSLKQNPGFVGWRYDMVKGYGGRYVGEYNDATAPYLSVGEFWDDDNRQHVVDWIDSTGGKSMAFDFPTRKLLKDALVRQRYQGLKTVDGKPTGVIGWWSAMSVTFVENHDTEEVRGDGKFLRNEDGQVMEAYAYILTHPGIPCVFWSHYFDWGDAQKQAIRTLIQIRRDSGVGRDSTVDIRVADEGRYAAVIDGKVAMKIGAGTWDPGDGWTLKASGNNYAVWIK